jgi:hypothetical protein
MRGGVAIHAMERKRGEKWHIGINRFYNAPIVVGAVRQWGHFLCTVFQSIWEYTYTVSGREITSLRSG